MNVYPAEVEAVLDAHPDVVESAVFGIPDDEWGQRVVAAYVGAADAGRPRRLGPRAAGRGEAAQEPAPARRPAPHLHRQGAPAGPAGGARADRWLSELGRRRRRRRARPAARWPPGWPTPAGGCCCSRPAPTTRSRRTSPPSSATRPPGWRAAVPGHPANWDLDRPSSSPAGPSGCRGAAWSAAPARSTPARSCAGTARGLRRLGGRRQRPVVLRARPAGLPPAGGRRGTSATGPGTARRAGAGGAGAAAATRWPTRSRRRPRSWASPPSRTRTPTGRPATGRCRSPCPAACGSTPRWPTSRPGGGSRSSPCAAGCTSAGCVVEARPGGRRGDRRTGVVRAAEVVLSAGAVGIAAPAAALRDRPGRRAARGGGRRRRRRPGRGRRTSPTTRRSTSATGRPARCRLPPGRLPLHGVLHATSSDGRRRRATWRSCPGSRRSAGSPATGRAARGRARRRGGAAAGGQPRAGSRWPAPTRCGRRGWSTAT